MDNDFDAARPPADDSLLLAVPPDLARLLRGYTSLDGGAVEQDALTLLRNALDDVLDRRCPACGCWARDWVDPEVSDDSADISHHRCSARQCVEQGCIHRTGKATVSGP
ncbi:hypothetical protein [Saccharothrix sp. HUAS TT1]|uniref:hypothetical protein n=1 Tax=unclassified Saccharothrix TaxID=2593673 RepID=UPI00345C40B9